MHKSVPAKGNILMEGGCAGGTPWWGGLYLGSTPSSPGPPGTPGGPQPCPSRAVLADISWHSPSASVPRGPGGGDCPATGHRVTQQQEQRSALAALHLLAPHPGCNEWCQGSPVAARHGKGLRLVTTASSAALAPGGTPACSLPSPCHLGGQQRSGPHAHAGGLDAVHPDCPPQAPHPWSPSRLPGHSVMRRLPGGCTLPGGACL